MRCPECNADNADNAKFCINCGAKLTAPPTKCPHCGEDVTPGMRFCTNCGQALGKEAGKEATQKAAKATREVKKAAPRARPRARAKRKSRGTRYKWAFIALAVVVVIAAVLVTRSLLTGKSDFNSASEIYAIDAECPVAISGLEKMSEAELTELPEGAAAGKILEYANDTDYVLVLAYRFETTELARDSFEEIGPGTEVTPGFIELEPGYYGAIVSDLVFLASGTRTTVADVINGLIASLTETGAGGTLAAMGSAPPGWDWHQKEGISILYPLDWVEYEIAEDQQERLLSDYGYDDEIAHYQYFLQYYPSEGRSAGELAEEHIASAMSRTEEGFEYVLVNKEIGATEAIVESYNFLEDVSIWYATSKYFSCGDRIYLFAIVWTPYDSTREAEAVERAGEFFDLVAPSMYCQ